MYIYIYIQKYRLCMGRGAHSGGKGESISSSNIMYIDIERYQKFGMCTYIYIYIYKHIVVCFDQETKHISYAWISQICTSSFVL